MAGWLPSSGRKTSARTTSPSSMRMGTSQSIFMARGILAPRNWSSVQGTDEGPAGQHVLGARPLEQEVEQRHGDLVVDRLALLGIDERVHADVGHDQLLLERERAQLLGQRGGVLDRETVQLRAALEDRLEPQREVFLDRRHVRVQAS